MKNLTLHQYIYMYHTTLLRLLGISVGAAVFFLVPGLAAAQTTWNATDYTFFDTITIDHTNINEDLTDFPVYVDLSDLSNQFWNTTPTGSTTVGTDIRVTNASNAELPRELVAASSTAQTGELHFKADSISSTTDTVFRVWYNGSTAGDYATTSTYGAQGVWSIYEYVSHDGGVTDSSANSATSTLNGGLVAGTAVGKVGVATKFSSSSSQYIESSFAGITGTATRTASVWMKSGNSDSDFIIAYGSSQPTDTGQAWRIALTSGAVGMRVYGGFDSFGSGYDDDKWHHVIMTQPAVADLTDLRTYVDGVDLGQGSNSSSMNTDIEQPLHIGVDIDSLSTDGYWNGEIDEIRFTTMELSSAWVSAEYTNQSTTTDFYAVNNDFVLSGVLYESDGVTPVAEAGHTVALAIATSTVSVHTTETDSNGFYIFSGIATTSLASTTPLTLFVDTNATTSSSSATTLTFAYDPALSTSMQGIDLHVDTLRLQHATGTQTIDLSTGTNFYDADDDGDTLDVLFAVESGTATVTASLRIASGTTLVAPTRLLIDGDFDNRGTFDANGGEVVTNALAYDLTSARHDSTADIYAGNLARGLYFGPGGSQLFMMVADGDEIREYSLTVPWDVRTASYTQSTSIAESVLSVGLTFARTGEHLYITDTDGDDLLHYQLTTAWDISTASFVSSTSAQSGSPGGVEISADGTRLYESANNNTNGIYVYELSTPYQLSTAVIDTNYALAEDNDSAQNIRMSLDGSQFFVLDLDDDAIYVYDLTTPYDMATLVDTGTVFSYRCGFCRGFAFGDNGSYVYTTDEGGGVDRYELDNIQHLIGTFTGSSSLYDLTVGDTATISPAYATEVANNYHVGGSAAGPYAGRVTLTGNSTLSGDGNFGFVEITGTASSTASATTFTDLTIASGGSFTASTTLTVTGDYIVETGGVSAIPRGNTLALAGQGTYELDLALVNTANLGGEKRDVVFSPDGQLMYVPDGNSGPGSSIRQYQLTEPWDISTAEYVTASSALAENVPRSLALSPDGVHMYIGQQNSIQQYVLTTPWDVSSAAEVYATSTNFSFTRSLTFSPTGDKLLVNAASFVNETGLLELAEPWDLSSVTSIDDFSLPAGSNGEHTASAVTADGRYIFGVRSSNQVVDKIEMVTPWDTTSLTFIESIDVSTLDTSISGPSGIAFAGDGSSLYVSDNTTDEIYQFEITANVSTTTDTSRLENVTINPSGRVTFAGPTEVRDLTIGTNATVTAPASTMTLDGDFTNNGTFDANGGEVIIAAEGFDLSDPVYVGDFLSAVYEGFRFGDNGVRLYAVTNNGQVDQYDLIEAYELSTASLVQSTTTNRDTYMQGLDLSPDGTQLYLYVNESDTIDQYNLSVPWDLSTAVYEKSTSTPVLSDVHLGDIMFSNDGVYVYIQQQGGVVYQYTLATPWDVGTAAQTASQSGFSGFSGGFYLSDDGTRIAITQHISRVVDMFTLNTPFDITSAVYEESFSVTGSSLMAGVEFSPSGGRLFVDRTSSVVSQYNLSDDQTFSGAMTGSSSFARLTQQGDQLLTFTDDVLTTDTFTIASTSVVVGATTTVFNAGSTYTFENIDWQGVGTSSEVVLRSSTSSEAWFLDVPGSQVTVEYIDVADSDASSGPEIVAATSTDSGNNTNWSFPFYDGLGTEWNDTVWTQYDVITIDSDNLSESLSDFPVYVDLADLSEAFWSGVTDDGGDIRVTTDEATPTELAREVVSASTTLETGELHFKAPFLNKDADTSFRIYYNGTDDDYATDQTYGAENVWTNDYLAVYHLDDDPAGLIVDSSGQTAGATAAGGMTGTDVTSGPLGDGTTFDGVDDRISFEGLASSTGLTVSTWINPVGWGEGDFGRVLENGRFTMLLDSFGGRDRFNFAVYRDISNGQWATQSDTVALNKKQYLVAAINDLNDTDEDAQLFIDGIKQITGEEDAPVGSLLSVGTSYIGNRASTDRTFDGLLDELRIASTSRSAGWISAEYRNQSTTTDFYYLGASVTAGSSTITDHDAGQVADAFDFQNKTDETLFAFKLTPESGTATVTRVQIDLSGAQMISVTNFSDIRLFRDVDSNAAFSGLDILLDSSGVMSPDGQSGQVTFATDFLATTSYNYIVVANWSAPDRGSQLTFSLYSDGIQMQDAAGGVEVFGSVASVQHSRLENRGGGSSGTGAPVGSQAPDGDGDVGGGTNDGGELIGDDPDFFWPTAESGLWDSPDNAFDQIDGTYATTSSNVEHDFSAFADPVPGSDTVEGIEVKLEVSGTTAAGDIGVELSWDGGASYTATNNTSTLTDTDTVVLLGGPSDTWGRSWTVAELNDSNFRVRVTGNPAANVVQIDAIQVKIYHQATGGGSGGGGAI